MPFPLLLNAKEKRILHGGAHLEKGVQLANASATLPVDCTHHCYGPFLYEPIWWAIHQATVMHV